MRSTPGWLLRSLVRAIASLRPADALIATSPLLIAVPHPDDETLACGGLIAKRCAQGRHPYVVVATDGSHGGRFLQPELIAVGRRRELSQALGRLGVPDDHIVTLGFEDGKLDRLEAELSAKLGSVLDELAPTTVIFTSAWDPHADHAALGRVLRGLAAERSIEAYEVLLWGWTTLGETARYILGRPPLPWQFFRWAFARSVNISDNLNAKRGAIAEYQSQLHPSASRAGIPYTRAGRSELTETGGSVGFGLLQQCLRRAELFFPASHLRL